MRVGQVPDFPSASLMASARQDKLSATRPPRNDKVLENPRLLRGRNIRRTDEAALETDGVFTARLEVAPFQVRGVAVPPQPLDVYIQVVYYVYINNEGPLWL
jgi:hypothetical protein